MKYQSTGIALLALLALSPLAANAKDCQPGDNSSQCQTTNKIDDNPSLSDLTEKLAGAGIDSSSLSETEVETVINSYTPYTPPAAPPAPTNYTGQDLLNAWLAPNSGINVTPGSVVYQGQPGQARVYTGDEAISQQVLNGTKGAVLTTGDATFADSNTSSGATKSYAFSGGTGSSIIQGINGGQTTYDANRLKLEFTLNQGLNGIRSDFVFASEEFPEWTSLFRDGFAMLVDGQNYAQFAPGFNVVMSDCTTLSPLCADSPNDPNAGTNRFLFSNDANKPISFEFDGYTKTLSVEALLDMSLLSHSIEVVIADSGDSLWDSAVFLSGLKGMCLGQSKCATTSTQPTTPSAVPLPAAAWLFGSALFGFVSLSRRRKV